MAKEKCLEILWLDGEAYRYVDILPIAAFQDCENAPFAYDVRGPRGGLKSVHCHLTVSGDTATLDYHTDKNDRAWNEAHDWFLGILELRFKSNNRSQIDEIKWREGAGKLLSYDIVPAEGIREYKKPTASLALVTREFADSVMADPKRRLKLTGSSPTNQAQLKYAVIAENDVSQWDDKTGELYHFPKRYADLIPPGTLVIYYKGKQISNKFAHVRKSADPHYFGLATIGRHISDNESQKGDLYAKIENFRPFEAVVYIRDPITDEPLEHVIKPNHWRDGVRSITEDQFLKILDLAGEYVAPRQQGKAKPKAPQGAIGDLTEKSIQHMVAQAILTAKNANGQYELRKVKNKEARHAQHELTAYVGELVKKQEGLCAISGLKLEPVDAYQDRDMICSLDRIDSSGHYERGNLQVVCRFINRWKSNDDNENFARLLRRVRSKK